jgi:hypothetical protein
MRRSATTLGVGSGTVQRIKAEMSRDGVRKYPHHLNRRFGAANKLPAPRRRRILNPAKLMLM